MPQEKAWEQEYQRPQLVTPNEDPQNDVKDFFKFLKKKAKITLENLRVLDLGSGGGRNANYLAERGNQVVGLEISPTAVALAQARAQGLATPPEYRLANIGARYPFPDQSFDLALDVMSSNSLNQAERAVYLAEVHRVLKPGAYFFVRGLCKDGDHNAKNLLKLHPGPEPDTYLNTDMGLVERVFTEADFRATYTPYFEIITLTKKTNYARFKGQPYKRNYWLGYLQNRV